jgi:hypothetical protein
MIGLLAKATVIWLIMVIIAIGNALLRDKLLAHAIGSESALVVSGLLLSILVFLVALGSVPFFGASDGRSYMIIGLVWFAFTLSFELLFGRFVAEKPWHEILQVFHLHKGDMFILVLLTTLFSPWLSAKTRGRI